MNVFEDLIDELKEEQLLEQTVIENTDPQTELPEAGEVSDAVSDETVQPEDARVSVEEILETEKFLKQLEAEELKEQLLGEPEDFTDFQFISETEPVSAQPARQQLNEIEYYRKRAMEEVSSLQMVDHIFSNVEREQMKIMPQPYDDFQVKKVLHSFLQVSGDLNSPEHAQAEFQLMQETEVWYSALAERDRKISVENLRYCCETTRPPLSPPALLALARYYRNSPFSETVRNKFDLIVTRLFSKDLEFEKRELVFTRAELIEHLTELYSEWESIPLEATEDEEGLAQLVQRFEDFMAEAQEAGRFEELIKSDFFNQFRTFKKSTGESFYVPAVAAASIECNIRVGNRYLELLEKEQEIMDTADLQEKYGILHDQLISNATSKTIQLVDLLEDLKNKPKPEVFTIPAPYHQTDEPSRKGASTEKKRRGKFGFLAGVNKYLLALTVLTIIGTAGLYAWVEMSESPLEKSSAVVQLDVQNLGFKDYVVSARISNEGLFAISSPAWESASKEKKEEVLMMMMMTGKDKGYKKVHLLDQQGKILAAATDNGVQIK